jgi:hypothetical protein
VNYEVRPEPSEEERAAIERAARELLREPQHPAYTSEWRRQAVREALGDCSLPE